MTSDSVSGGGRTPDELASQVRFLEAEVTDLRRRLDDAPGRLARPRAAARRRPALAGGRDLPERAARPDPARGPRPDHEAQGGGRPAGPAAGRLRHLPRPQRGRLDRRLHRRPQAAGQRQPQRRPRRRSQRGQEVMLNEALNVVAALEFEEVGEVVMLKELLADGERALVIANADEERVVRLAEPLRERHHPRRRLAAAGLPGRLRLREGPEVRGRGARPRGGPRHRLRRRSAASAARSSRSATPSSCPTCTPSCSRSTSSSRPRACCSTARPAAARR